MIFERKKYLDELIAGRGNGLVKIIIGVRRCGKSFLLFDIWHNWLLEHGVTDSHIIEIQLDDFRNRRLRKPDALLDYIDSKVMDDGKPYYIVLDEVQLVEEFVEVILSLTHMENIIYNELRCRGYNVDVGLVELGGKDENGKFVRKQLEVDFVVNRPPYRVYIQSAFHMPTPEKEQQERRPLLSINDHFRKIVIVGDDIHRKEDELGVLTVGLLDFLTDKNLLEQG